MKIIKIISAVLLLAVISLGIAFWTPDTTYSEMRAKYGGAPSQFLELGEVGPVHFRDQGLRSGRTIVLVHGTSASLHTWEPLVAKLKNAFRLVSFDLPGHGSVSYTHLTLPTILLV